MIYRNTNGVSNDNIIKRKGLIPVLIFSYLFTNWEYLPTRIFISSVWFSIPIFFLNALLTTFMISIAIKQFTIKKIYCKMLRAYITCLNAGIRTVLWTYIPIRSMFNPSLPPTVSVSPQQYQSPPTVPSLPQQC